MIRAIDEIGQTVEYVQATRWAESVADSTIHLYADKEIVAIVPGHWIVSVVPFSQIDPGVEARD